MRQRLFADDRALRTRTAWTRAQARSLRARIHARTLAAVPPRTRVYLDGSERCEIRIARVCLADLQKRKPTAA